MCYFSVPFYFFEQCIFSNLNWALCNSADVDEKDPAKGMGAPRSFNRSMFINNWKKQFHNSLSAEPGCSLIITSDQQICLTSST